MKFKMAPGNKLVKMIKIALIGFYDPENLGVASKIKTLHTYLTSRDIGQI